jgi:AcrR family transcriptional regulator
MRDLNTEQIAVAGLAIVDERGAAGLTMRAVAERLGVTPMSLYHHVADKSALVALVVDRSITECVMPGRTGAGWQDDLCALGHWMRKPFTSHPGASQLRRQYRVLSPAMLAIGERWLAIWRDSGLPLEAAQRAATTSAMAILGVLEEQLFAPIPLPDELVNSLPNLREYIATRPDLDDDFELLLRALIHGLHAQLSKSPPADAERKPKRRRVTR